MSAAGISEDDWGRQPTDARFICARTAQIHLTQICVCVDYTLSFSSLQSSYRVEDFRNLNILANRDVRRQHVVTVLITPQRSEPIFRCKLWKHNGKRNYQYTGAEEVHNFPTIYSVTINRIFRDPQCILLFVSHILKSDNFQAQTQCIWSTTNVALITTSDDW